MNRTPLLCSLFVLFVVACVTTKTPVRLDAPRAMTVAVVVDSGGSPPPALLARLDSALEERNVQMTVGSAPQSRLTSQRLAALSDGEDALLVELNAAYYSQLNGVFRWVVSGRVSLRPVDGEVIENVFERPVFLQFAHEDAEDALLAADESVLRAALYVVDSYLAGRAPARPAPLGAIYFPLIDRYADGDPGNNEGVARDDPQAFYGGDLEGIRKDLDRLRALGVRTLWLSPLWTLRGEKIGETGGFHGYWIEDFASVEPRFGGERALDDLVAAADERDIALMLDVVLNHAAPGAPIVTARPELFHDNGDIVHWDDPVEAITHDVHGLPDFAQERPAAAAFLIDSYGAFVERTHPAAIRIDAARHMPPAFLRDFGEAMRARRPGLVVVGEYWEGGPVGLAERAREAGFDAVYDFPLYYALTAALCEGRGFAEFASTSALARVFDNGGRGLVTFVDNHDLPRIASKCADDDKVYAALVLSMLSRGTPALTWGTEVPLRGASEPDNRAPMRFDSLPLADALTLLLALRETYPALVDAPTRFLAAREAFVAFERPLEDTSVFIAANFGPDLVEQPAGLTEVHAASRGTCEIDGEQMRVGTRSVCVFEGPNANVAIVERNVTFSLADDVIIVGAAPELGGWDIARAPRAEDGEVRVELPGPAVYTYKLVKRGTPPVWETGANRVLVIGEEDARATPRWGS